MCLGKLGFLFSKSWSHDISVKFLSSLIRLEYVNSMGCWGPFHCYLHIPGTWTTIYWWMPPFTDHLLILLECKSVLKMAKINLSFECIDEELELNCKSAGKVIQNRVPTQYACETLCCWADGSLHFAQAGTSSGHVASFIALNYHRKTARLSYTSL